ncbi:hypothetical protein OEZ86_003651 [Tetradesmus obliquus]|nr:hypothetical protein OEZ86_003651 [Tetradesmus obliquus]
MALAMKSRAFKAGAAGTRSAARPARAAVVSRASRGQEVTLFDRLAPSLLAAAVTLSGATAMDAAYAPPAFADDEEVMSPYQKRQAELERRRELLREAREKAAARASGEAAPAAAPAAAAAPAPAPASDFASRAAGLKKEASSAYESAAKNRPAAPAPTPAESEEPSTPLFGGFSFSKPAEPAPAPAAPAPAASSSSGFSTPPDPWKSTRAPVAPVPVPVPVPAPAPAKIEVKKDEPAQPKPAPAAAKPASDLTPNGKHRTHGIMPLWLGEILVLGSYIGLGLAVTKYASQSEAVLKAAGQKVKEAYEAAEKLVGSKLKGSSA